MGLFKSKYEKAMDDCIKHIEVNMSNNYKDAAQSNFKEFEELYTKFCSEGALKDKVKTEYGEKLEEYRAKLKATLTRIRSLIGRNTQRFGSVFRQQRHVEY